MEPGDERKVSGGCVYRTQEIAPTPLFPLPLAWDTDVTLMASLGHVDKDNTLRHRETRQSRALRVTGQCSQAAGHHPPWTTSRLFREKRRSFYLG